MALVSLSFLLGCRADLYLSVLTRGRRDEAWSIISRLHDNGSDDAQGFARDEFDQMEKQVELDNIAWATQGGNKQLFTKASYRKRMVCLCPSSAMAEYSIQ